MSTVHLAALALVVGADSIGTHPQAVNEKLREYIAARSAEFGTIPQPRRRELQKIALTSGRVPVRAGRRG
jgi:hypothetical protein